MNKKVKFLLKAGISITFISYLLSSVDYKAVYYSLVSASPLYLLLAFLTLFIGKLISGYRWQLLLSAQGIGLPLRTLVASLYVGQFFNSFLPTTIGGDVVRAYDTASASKQAERSVVVVFMDRLIGVLALVFLAVIALIVATLSGEMVSFYLVPVLIVFLICVFGLVIVLGEKNVERVGIVLEKIGLVSLADGVGKMGVSVQDMRNTPRVLFSAFILSSILQINVVIFHFCISLALGLSVPMIYYFIIVPIALTVLILPFSINGIGLREGIFMFLLAGVGVSPPDAIALSLLSFFLILTQAVIGGIIFAFRGEKISELNAQRSGW